MTNNFLPHGPWLRTVEACKQLNICRDSLQKYKREGLFKAGVHFIHTGPSKCSPLLWNVNSTFDQIKSWHAPQPED